MKPIKQHRTFGLVLAAICLLATAACGGGTKASAGDASGNDTLRVVLQAEPGTLNPAFSVYSDSRAWGPMFDSLVGFDKQTLKYNQDGLLTNWTRNGDKEWVFDVRPGVKFQNGEDFNAEAAAFTIKEWRDNPASIWRAYYAVVADAKAQGGKLVVTTTEPFVALPYILTVGFAIPPAYYQKVGAEKFAQKPIGTGPYELASYQSGQSLSLKRFDGYWRGKPKMAGIDFTWNSVASSRYSLLASGDVDFAIDMQPQDVKSIEASSNLKVDSGETVYGQTVFLNALKPALRDVRLREAAAMAIDRNALVKSVFQGVGAVPSSFFIGNLLETGPAEFSVPFDPEGAKKLIAEVGGKPKIVFGYTSGKFPNDNQLGQAVAGMLRGVGFDVVQKSLEYGTYRDQRNAGAFDVFMQEIAPTFNHPATFTSYFLGEGALLKSCDNAAEYDALNNKALTAQTVADGDPIYTEMEKKLITEDVCYVPIDKTVYSFGMSDRVQGFEAPRDASPNYYAISLK